MEVILICGEGIEEDRVLLLLLCVCLDVCVFVSVCMHACRMTFRIGRNDYQAFLAEMFLEKRDRQPV